MIRYILSLLILFIVIFSPAPNSALAHEIHDAAVDGDLEKVKTLVRQDPSLIDLIDNSHGECTPLYLAASMGHKDIVRFLISNGADVNSIDYLGRTPLHEAASPDIARLLIAAGADPRARDNAGKTPLHETSSPEIARLLIEAGAHVNARDNKGETPLHKVRSEELAAILIAEGADVRSQSYNKVTPLHEASGAGKIHIVKLLHSRGAKINERSENKSTPLHYALLSSSIEVAEYLISNGAEINAARSDGQTPLSFATDVGEFPPSFWVFRVAPRKKIITLLAHHGARVDTIIEAIASDNVEKTASFLKKNPHKMNNFFNYGTPLYCAAFWGSSNVAAFLLQKGAGIDAGTEFGTPLIVSSAKGNREMTGLLISRGADVNARERYGMTPLYAAVVTGNEKVFLPYYDPRACKYFAFPSEGNGVKEDSVEIVKLLAAAGADVNFRPEFPNSDKKRKKSAYPLQIAVMKDWVEMARVLLSAGAQSIINEKDDIWHYTPLHHAAEQGNKTLVSLLLAHGANVSVKDDRGRTPLAIAVEKGYMDIAVLLQRHGARE